MSWNNYYVDGANGNDSNNGETVATAFETIQHALDKITDGTIAVDSCIHIMDTQVYEINGHGNNLDTGADLQCIITGANSSGEVDGTQATIRATGTWSDTSIGLWMSDHKQYTYMNIIFDANNLAEYAWLRAGSGADSVHFINCRFTKAKGWGCYQNNSYYQYYACEFDNNGDADTDLHGGSYRTYYGQYYKCVFRDNLGYGCYCPGQRNTFDQCVFSNNSRYGLALYGECRVADSIFEGNDRGAIYMHGHANYMPGQIINCVFRGNANESTAISSVFSTNDTYYGTLMYNIFDDQVLNNQKDGGMTAGSSAAVAARFKFFPTNTIGSVFYEGPTSDCGVTADDHFGNTDLTPRRDSAVVGAGLPLLYKIRGSTASDIGMGHTPEDEQISVF